MKEAHWEKIRESGDPKTSPAIEAFAETLFMSRQVRLHVLLVAQSATARETQVLNLSEAEARAWVMARGKHELPALAKPPAAVPHFRDTHTGGDPEAEACLRAVGEEALIGLRDAQKEWEGTSLAALRGARRNDPEFPGHVGKTGAECLYRPEALHHWARNRPRRAAHQ